VSDEEVLGQLGRPTRVAIMNGRHVFSDVLRDVSNRIAPAFLRDDGRRVATERSITIAGDTGALAAEFGGPQIIPGSDDPEPADSARGLVILADGYGGSRHSYRNRYVAGRLRLSGYATLRVDLLTAEEQRSENAALIECDVERIAERLTHVCEWVARTRLDGAHRPILVGASTGAAAALATAARRPAQVFAVIARAGRVELAADLLRHVTAPVLLIVGAADRETLLRNGEAMRALPRGALLIRVPRASHTFAEPGALGAVAEQTVRWLDRLERRSREAGSRHA
jgi:dienelactone hydrolase